MKSKNFLFWVGLSLNFILLAQFGHGAEGRVNTSVGIGTLNRASLSYQRLYAIDGVTGLRVGYMVRATYANRTATRFETAPADIRRGEPGWLPSLWADKIANNIDTLEVKTTNLVFANIGYAIEYNVNNRWGFGHNLDLLGATYGAESDSVYSANTARTRSSQSATTRSRPAPFNFLLIADNDVGSLSSEYFGYYRLNPKWLIRAGIFYDFVEYLSATTYAFNNDRFRFKSTGLFVGFSYVFDEKAQ